MTLSLKELWTEYDYRLSERLGVLAEDRPPTPEQLAIATKEADCWLREMTATHQLPNTTEQLDLLK